MALKKITLIITNLLISFIVLSQEVTTTKIDSLDTWLSHAGTLVYENKLYEALELTFKAITYSHKLENNYYLSYSYFTMALAQQQIMDYNNAEEQLLKAVKYSELTEDKTFLPYIYHNLAVIYYNDKKDYEKALLYHKMAYELKYKKNEISPDLFTPLNNIVWTLFDLNKYKEAIPYLHRLDSTNLLIEDDNSSAKASYYIVKGQYYTHTGETDQALSYFNKSLEILNKTTDWPKGKSFLYQYRSLLYEKIKDYPNAILDLKKMRTHEHLTFEAAQLRINEIAKIRFAVDQYERELEVARREKTLLLDIAENNKTIIYTTCTAIILLMGVLFFYYQGYRSKKRSSEVLKVKNEELSRAKSKTDQLGRIKSQFISTISHELRTPLYGVVGIASILLEKGNYSKSDKKLLNSLEFSANYLLNLVNNILKVSKMDSDKREFINTPTDINDLVGKTVKSLEHQAKDKGNELFFEPDDQIPYKLEVAPLQIAEILINLIGNAIKFTSKGKIWVRLKLVSKDLNTIKIRFEVEDTGIGIPDDQKENIFEEFSQVGSIYEYKQGTGLGLSIVKSILAPMNSKIQLESQQNVGSKFFFELDLNITEETPIDTTFTLIKHKANKNENSKILVAEDNKINQIVTKKLLQSIGYECIIAENGQEALEIAQKEDIQMILMDIHMPILDGVIATKKIREFDKSTPIIALTASELSEVADECLNVGMNDMINKPLHKSDLLRIIHKNLKLNCA